MSPYTCYIACMSCVGVKDSINCFSYLESHSEMMLLKYNFLIQFAQVLCALDGYHVMCRSENLAYRLHESGAESRVHAIATVAIV